MLIENVDIIVLIENVGIIVLIENIGIIMLIEIDKDSNKKSGSIYIINKSSGVIAKYELGRDCQ